MKNIFFAIALLFASTSIFAQNKTSKEIGISRQGILLGYFGFTYRQEKADNKFRRYEVITHNTSIINPINLQSGFTLKTGVEKRKTLENPNWQYTKGWMYGIGISNMNGSEFGNKNPYITPSIGYSFGWQYTVSPKFAARIEITPTLSQDIKLANHNQATSRGLGLSAPVTVSFCWRK